MKVLVAPLNNGVLMPAVGLGTFKSDNPDVAAKALSYGYCAVDTADYYENYDMIKAALNKFEASRPREIEAPSTKIMKNPCVKKFQVIEEADFLKNMREAPHGTNPDNHTVFLTTKVWPPLSSEKVKTTVDCFFKECDRKQGDLILLHWPGLPKEFNKQDKPDNDNLLGRRLEAWRELEKLYHEKKFRAIGVSNFMENHLKQLLDDIDKRKKEGDKYAMYPAVDQFEISPWLKPKKELRDLCDAHNIHLIAYSPLGAQRVNDSISHPVVVDISKKHQKSPAQIILRYVLQTGVIIIPKSNHPERVLENYNLFDFELDDEDMQKLDINDGSRSCPNPYLIE